MKLLEVIQYSKRTPRQPNMGKTVGNKAVSGGAFSTVVNAPGAVEKVVKFGKSAREEAQSDGYLAWLEQIHNNPNPFFPVIDKLKIYPQQEISMDQDRPDKVKRQQYQVRMEKLQPLSGLSEREAQYVLSRYFGVDLNDHQKQLIQKHIETFPEGRRPGGGEIMASMVAEILDDIVRENGCGEIQYFLGGKIVPVIPCVSVKDDNLKEAIAIMKKMKQQGYLPDIHYNNIMVRRSPYGPQPVITDPFMYHQDVEGQA